MQALIIKKTIKTNKHTLSLLGTDTEVKYLHVDNHKDDSNSVVVPVDKVKELLKEEV